MNINTKFSIATHIILCISFFEDEGATSTILAKSVKTNPAIIRRILLKLKEEDITLLAIYKAIFSERERSLFNFHEPNHICPVGCAMFDVLGEEFNNVRIAFETSLSKITIKKIMNEVRRRKKHLAFMNK